MDRIDRAIIDQLRRDCRMTNTELADRVGLTPSPCLRRVKQLEDSGVIVGYHARVDPRAIGRAFEVNVQLGLAAMDRGTVERFEARLTSYDEVVEIRRLFGSPDYLILVAVEDQTAYERFLTQELMAVPGLATLTSHFTMKVIKSEAPPIRPRRPA
ncbi:Lrp/AsnC family transcriptional regulator [Asanoa sp. WMMD1127]|uniref:Lrp/AsnC family transcriptional regulator n=1 Tax=Asanoa sp. WMMD1127 TaxID=3016107 RepID=UPI00241713B6|nr:Lrp/AsnC family transcriptional regulator [Asanoa sp. WMMD1127]MDG4826278.1 Lrp/AsnC family transcriptional regulator [Asanoa sp. WMMD1127]